MLDRSETEVDVLEWSDRGRKRRRERTRRSIKKRDRSMFPVPWFVWREKAQCYVVRWLRKGRSGRVGKEGKALMQVGCKKVRGGRKKPGSHLVVCSLCLSTQVWKEPWRDSKSCALYNPTQRLNHVSTLRQVKRLILFL